MASSKQTPGPAPLGGDAPSSAARRRRGRLSAPMSHIRRISREQEGGGLPIRIVGALTPDTVPKYPHARGLFCAENGTWPSSYAPKRRCSLDRVGCCCCFSLFVGFVRYLLLPVVRRLMFASRCFLSVFHLLVVFFSSVCLFSLVLVCLLLTVVLCRLLLAVCLMPFVVRFALSLLCFVAASCWPPAWFLRFKLLLARAGGHARGARPISGRSADLPSLPMSPYRRSLYGRRRSSAMASPT